MTPVVKTQLRILFLIGVGILALTAFAGAVQYSTNQADRRHQEQNDAQLRFWRIIGGTEVPSTFSVETVLAKDLRSLINAPQALDDFRGDSNRYGGISAAIGFDPFSGANCSECGPLDVNVRRNLDLIAQGDLDKVLANEKVTYDTGYTLTLFGVSVLNQLIFLYLIFGPISYNVAHQVMDQKPQPDGQMLASIPLAYAWRRIKQKRSGRKDDSEIRRQFPDYCNLLDDVDESIASLPPGDDRSTLKKRRDEVRIELLRQVHSSHSAKSQDEMKELTDALDMLSTTLKARSQAREDMDNWT